MLKLVRDREKARRVSPRQNKCLKYLKYNIMVLEMYLWWFVSRNYPSLRYYPSYPSYPSYLILLSSLSLRNYPSLLYNLRWKTYCVLSQVKQDQELTRPQRIRIRREFSFRKILGQSVQVACPVVNARMFSKVVNSRTEVSTFKRTGLNMFAVGEWGERPP